MSDELANLKPEELAGWYERLAELVEKQNADVKDALSPRFLKYWLKGRGKKLIFPPPEHLRNSDYVIDTLKFHRAVYLSEKKAKVDAGEKWAGLIPRLQGKGYPKWPGQGILTMHYESLVDIPVLKELFLSKGDLDLLMAMHGFQLITDVGATVSAGKKSSLSVSFNSFSAKVSDSYHWNPDKHLTMPNPDYGNPSKVPNPVAPKSQSITVYHKNAIRLEKAGLAWAYDLESEPWQITDLSIRGPATIDPNKKLDGWF
jgi:hypothetical protein